MKKKFSPGVLLTAFALSLFMSMSLKSLEAQEGAPSPVVKVNPTATGVKMGVTPTTATGVSVGATTTTASGLSIGATTILPPTPEQLQRGAGYQPGLEVPERGQNQSGSSGASVCLRMTNGVEVCGREALEWCKLYPDSQSCQSLIR